MSHQETVPPDPQDIAALRAVIDAFIEERLQAKLDKLGEDADAPRQKLREEHQREVWIADAARRVVQLQLVTHTLKPIHPDARGSSVYLRDLFCSDATIVGTHGLNSERADDVVGNAAALDVFKFLKLIYAGNTLVALALARDPLLLAALSDDTELAQPWLDAFACIADSKNAVASHRLAKQLYFPLPGGGYHVLAPLFPSALAHRLHLILQADRFSDEAKAARVARREDKPWPVGYREYANLAIQNFGGSKPQNISQLNSERRGENVLLPSLPPIWRSEPIRPPLGCHTVFGKYGPFGMRRAVRETTSALSKLLANSRDYTNVNIRRKRAEMIDDVIDMLFLFTAELQALPGGWSRRAGCSLDPIEKRWLDPTAVHDLKGHAWRTEIASRFANWLNVAISTDQTRMGDDAHRAWKTLLEDRLNQFKEEMTDET